MQYLLCMITTPQRLLTRAEEDIMASKKFLYEEPAAQVIEFVAEDILTESGDNWKDPAELEEIPD